MTVKWLDEAEINFSSKRVLCRFDLNTPLTKEGEIADDARILAAVDTIRFLQCRDAKIIIASHLGRPKGKKRSMLAMLKVAERLQAILGQSVIYTPDPVSEGTVKLSQDLKNGEILVLENLRFHAGEEKNDLDFAKKLRLLGDIFVSDAFGVMHREHASAVALPKLFKTCLGGLLLKKEIKALTRLKRECQAPYVAVLGGAKAACKINLIVEMLKSVDKLLIGGALAFTFMKAKGSSVGLSKVDESAIATARRVLDLAGKKGVEILLPVDNVVVEKFHPDAPTQIVSGANFGVHSMGIDIGPVTIKMFKSAIKGAKTIFANGTLGIFEWKNAKSGTFEVMREIAASDAYSVVGGGDSLLALRELSLEKEISHASTGGGASLAFLQGSALPGLLAIGFEK